ncbi:DUF2637 domain-containing protein [Nocardia sp. NPDC057272]|uniref:DUF2637 domain-containing protein n=1 Tax=Nocardia sp. NPDC057272 TaxID=3346079 RepID=UPI00362BA412
MTATAGDTATTNPAEKATTSHQQATAGDNTVAPVSPKRIDLAEITALAMTLVIGAGAFAWSFAALSDLSVMAGINPKLAWIGPVFVDGAIVQSTVALVSLQRRQRANITVARATTAFFWVQLMTAEVISIVGNGLHAAESGQRALPAIIAACVAGAAPLAGLAATHGLTALLEVPREPTRTPAATTPTAKSVGILPETIADSTAPLGDGQATAGDAEATTGDTPTEQGDTQATPSEVDATADRDSLILAMAAEGRSTREIGPVVGLHHGTVAKIVARHREAEQALDTDTGLRLIAGTY